MGSSAALSHVGAHDVVVPSAMTDIGTDTAPRSEATAIADLAMRHLRTQQIT